MKILLAYQSGVPHRKDPYISLLPTGLCYLHACLCNAGYDSLLANFSAWTQSRIKQRLEDFRPDVIGISQWTHNRHSSLQLAGLCREILPDCTILMGGGHATFCYEDILTVDSPIDAVVLGEAELTLLELVAHVSAGSDWQNIEGLAVRRRGRIIRTSPRKSLDDLDRLPLPAQYLDRSVGVDIELQAEFIVTTRGCPSTCHFCSSPDFWGTKVRFRSPAAIVEEIRYIRQKFGLIYFSIRDDTFTADRRRVLEFCSLLQNQKINILWNCQSRVTAIDEKLVTEMKRAGCECIQLGVESASAHILQQLGKNIRVSQIEAASSLIREAGINLSVFLISNVPGETEGDIQNTIDLVKHIRPDDGYVSRLAYYPGTKLFNNAVASGNVSRTVFSDTKQTAIYVAAHPDHHSARLLKELAKNQPADPERFVQQKSRIGYCFTTNIIAGEWYRHRGKFENAENELKEITTEQPDNPWGWFLLGDLYSGAGRIKKSRECYARVLTIVPEHGPSKSALSKA